MNIEKDMTQAERIAVIREHAQKFTKKLNRNQRVRKPRPSLLIHIIIRKISIIGLMRLNTQRNITVMFSDRQRGTIMTGIERTNRLSVDVMEMDDKIIRPKRSRIVEKRNTQVERIDKR